MDSIPRLRRLVLHGRMQGTFKYIYNRPTHCPTGSHLLQAMSAVNSV